MPALVKVATVPLPPEAGAGLQLYITSDDGVLVTVAVLEVLPQPMVKVEAEILAVVAGPTVITSVAEHPLLEVAVSV